MPDEATLTIRFDEAGAATAGAPSKPAPAVNPQTAARDKAQADAGGLANVLGGQKAAKGLEAFGKRAAGAVGKIPGVGKAAGLASRLAGGLGLGGGAAGGAGAAGAAAGGAGAAAAGAGAAAGGAAAGGGALAAIGGAVAATGPAAPIAAVVAVTAGTILLAVKKGLAMAEAKTAELAAAGVSPEIAAQQARAEAATIKSQQRQAEILGEELARIGEAKTAVSLDFEEIKSVLLAPFFDILADLLEVIQTITEPIADLMVAHAEDIKRIIKWILTILSPMLAVIQWWADVAGAGDEPEIDDPVLELIRLIRAEPVPRPVNVMADGRQADGPGQQKEGAFEHGAIGPVDFLLRALVPGGAAIP